MQVTPLLPSRRTRKRAFTLFEVMIVIAIIMILISLLLPAVQRAGHSAKTSSLKSCSLYKTIKQDSPCFHRDV